MSAATLAEETRPAGWLLFLTLPMLYMHHLRFASRYEYGWFSFLRSCLLCHYGHLLCLHTAKVGAVIKYCESPKSYPEFRSRFRACACTQERCMLLRSIYVMRRFRKKGKNRENTKTTQRDKILLNLRAVVYVLFVPDAPHIREITERRLA